VWNIAQIILFNYTCFEEMTAPHFFPSPGIKLFGDSDHAECSEMVQMARAQRPYISDNAWRCCLYSCCWLIYQLMTT